VVCESFDVLSCQTALEVERFSQLYMDAWVALDPESTGFIPVEKLQELLESLPLPFGAPKNKSKTLSSYFKSKTVRLKMLFIKRNMTGSSLSFHETFLLLVILHSVGERRLESVRYVQYVRQMKAELVVYNFVRLKAKAHGIAAKFAHRFKRKMRDKTSGKKWWHTDVFVSSRSASRIDTPQRSLAKSKDCLILDSHVAADEGSSISSSNKPDSSVSLESISPSAKKNIISIS